jgi:hypothetical protein
MVLIIQKSNPFRSLSSVRSNIRLAVTTLAIAVLRNLPTGWSRAAPSCFSACEGIALELRLKLMMGRGEREGERGEGGWRRRRRRRRAYSLSNFWPPYLWQKQWSLQYCQTPILPMKVCEKEFPPPPLQRVLIYCHHRCITANCGEQSVVLYCCLTVNAFCECDIQRIVHRDMFLQ